MKTLHSPFQTIKPHLIVWLLLLAVCVCGCRTVKTNTDKNKSNTDVKKEEVKTEIKTEVEVKKKAETSKSETKADISKENKTTEEIITYFPKKDSAGNQLIASRTKRDINLKETDQSLINNERVLSIIDSLNRKRILELNLKIDSNNQHQNIIKTKDADSTLANNIPWWFWVLGLIALLVFLAVKIK